MSTFQNFCLLLALFAFINGCSSSKEATQQQNKNYYSKTAETAGLDRWLDENFDLIVRIQSTVFYQTHNFAKDQNFMPSGLNEIDLKTIAESSTIDNESRAGTAVMIAEANDNYLLLTANHIVSYPDTLWHYRDRDSGVLSAVSVKVRDSFSLLTENNIGPIKPVATDSHRDLALMTTAFDLDDEPNPGTIRAGNSSELNWADFVYAIGYPKGIKVISSGLVSLSERLKETTFTIDAPFNKGFSGGIILAVNNSTSEPEWVGMITSTTSDTEYLMTPGTITQNNYTPEVPFNDSIFVERFNRINYGLTHTVSINEIKKFLDENRDTLSNYGFGLHGF